MSTSNAYRIIAGKYLHARTFTDVVIPNSIFPLLTFLFTEAEAELVATLGLAMKSTKAIAKAVHRPLEGVEPILASLAEALNKG